MTQVPTQPMFGSNSNNDGDDSEENSGVHAGEDVMSSARYTSD